MYTPMPYMPSPRDVQLACQTRCREKRKQCCFAESLHYDSEIGYVQELGFDDPVLLNLLQEAIKFRSNLTSGDIKDEIKKILDVLEENE